jgi:oligopeptide/dipeptide ABC transporter ATP-binding protein
MYLGRMVELATVAELYEHPRHPYTVALLSAVPQVERAKSRKRIVLRGDVPSPVNPPSGCHFHPRCWLRERLGSPEICATADPRLAIAGEGHAVACHFADRTQEEQERAATPVATPA